MKYLTKNEDIRTFFQDLELYFVPLNLMIDLLHACNTFSRKLIKTNEKDEAITPI